MIETFSPHENEGNSILVLILLVFFASVFAYALLIAGLSIPWLQRLYVKSYGKCVQSHLIFRSALYAHKIRTPIFWHNIYRPEAFGFACAFYDMKSEPFDIILMKYRQTNHPIYSSIYRWGGALCLACSATSFVRAT